MKKKMQNRLEESSNNLYLNLIENEIKQYLL